MSDREKRLADIAAREQAATKGPWKWWTSNSHRRLRRPDGGPDIAYGMKQDDGTDDIIINDADMAFTEHAREDIPWLLSEVRDSVSTEDVIDIIYATLNAAMVSGDESAVKACLRRLVGMSLTVMLAGVSISLPWASKLREERTALVDAIRAADPERANELLRGLIRGHI